MLAHLFVISTLTQHFFFKIEPQSLKTAEPDENWISAKQEELNQFEENKVWNLAPRPNHHQVIGTKWVHRNKLDEASIIFRKKTRLVAQRLNQEGGIDYDETFVFVARLEAIRTLLTFSCYNNFKLFQMDAKGTILYDCIKEKFISDDLPVLKVLIFQSYI